MNPFDGTIPDPADRQAAMVFAKGAKPYEPKPAENHFHSEGCPPVIPWLAPSRKDRSQDLTGRRVGRLTVIGYSRDHPSRWVVRCSCGDYELRKARAIKNPLNTDDACRTCVSFRSKMKDRKWKKENPLPEQDSH